MKRHFFWGWGILLLLFSGCSDAKILKNQEEGLYAEIETTRGSFLVRFDYENTPIAVVNFLGLALGKIDYYQNKLDSENESTQITTRGNFYENTYFTVAEEGFILQGGDPIGDGTGTPGYFFDDEIVPNSFQNEGVMGMANDGANTNGSQFFITFDALPELEDRYTAFGQVVSGLDTAREIEVGDRITKITLHAKGKEAKGFKISQEHFDELRQAKRDKRQERDEEIKKSLQEKNPKLIELPSGILYEILRTQEGESVNLGDTVEIHYTLSLLDGELIESSQNQSAAIFDGGRSLQFLIGSQEIPPGLNEVVLLLSQGSEAVAYLPPQTAFAERAYRSDELAIPPYSWIKLEISLLDIKKGR